MRRVALTSLAAACMALAAPAGLTPSALGAKQPKRSDARARLIACKPALSQLNRSLTVDSIMRSLEAGDRMQMRFDLYQRTPRSLRWRRLAGPGLGTWNPASPGVDRFRFRKPIQNLPAPALYYVKVSFRWLNAQGATTARTSRRTATCFQPDRRPDLRIAEVGVPRRSGPYQITVRVVVRNTGATASGDFDALLTVAGEPAPALTVGSLPARSRRAIELTGPRCAAGSTGSVALDPDDRVDEARESNNRRSFACL